MPTVVDASALAKVFLEEEHAETFRSFVKDRIEENAELIAPDLITYEMGNIVTAQFPGRDEEERTRILEDALTLIRQVPLEDPGRVLAYAGEVGTFYDASYLWIARREDADLVTYDETLASTAGAHDVTITRPGVDGHERE